MVVVHAGPTSIVVETTNPSPTPRACRGGGAVHPPSCGWFWLNDVAQHGSRVEGFLNLRRVVRRVKQVVILDNWNKNNEIIYIS